MNETSVSGASGEDPHARRRSRSAQRERGRTTTKWFVATVLLVPLLAADPPWGESPPALAPVASPREHPGKPVDPAPAVPQDPQAGKAELAPGAMRVRKLLAADDWRQAQALALALATSGEGAGPDERAALGEALFRAGELEQAATALAGLSDLADAPARGVLTLARLNDAEGRHEDAERLAERAVAAAPDDPTVLYWAADITARQRSIELLERYLARASADEDPDRIEAARGSLRVLRSLGDRRVWVAQTLPERLELPLALLWDPTSGRTRGYIVEARLGARKPTRLLLDSGSPGLFVLERIARKNAFAPLAETTSFGGGGDRRHATSRGILPELDLGGLRFADPLCTTTAHELEATGRYHGLIGLVPFGGYRITIDFAARQLRLEPPSATPLGDPYWIVGGQMLVRAADGEGRSGLFLFDTGASRTLLADSFVEGRMARVVEQGEVAGFGGRFEGLRSVAGVRLLLQGRSSDENLYATDLSLQSRLGGVELSGFIGLDVLEQGPIVIDTRHRRVMLGAPRP